MSSRSAAFALVLSLVAALGGCAPTRFENAPLASTQPNAERRAIDVARGDRPLILVAVSGGGSRAAALGWSVLHELRSYSYTLDGQPHRLVDDIAVVSSVSGGSVIAAHFALNGADGLDRFVPEFLEPDNMRTLAIDAANPLGWLQLAFTGSSRVDKVEALFDRQLFHEKTFAELNQPGHPYLILNATDMASGEVFAFTPGRFDDVCSDLDGEKISVGVAASSAVPIVLSPIALKNHSGPACAGTDRPAWIARELNSRYSPYLNLSQFKLARYANDLRRGPDPFRTIDYLYLVDGGLADNLAIHGLLETIASPYAAPVVASGLAPGRAPSSVLAAINAGTIRKVVVIVINARAEPAKNIATDPDRPGILAMIGAVSSIPIDSTTSSVGSQMDGLLGILNAAGAGGAGDPRFAGLRVYGIQIDFDQLRTSDATQLALRQKAKSVPTLWTISKDNREVIDQAGTLLLRQHPCFQHLLIDLQVPADFIDRTEAVNGCRQAADPR